MIRPNLQLRVAVTLSGYPSSDPATQFELTLRTAEGELNDWLPGGFAVDGSMADGTLVLIADSARHVTYTGNRGKSVYDYVQLTPAARYVGFDVHEPLVPMDVLAQAEHGLVTVERVAPDRWTPRAWVCDPRVERVERMLADGMPWDKVAARLIASDRLALEDLIEGRTQPHRVPPHVARLYRERP